MEDPLNPYPGNLRMVKTDQIPDYDYDRGANIIWLLRTMNNRLGHENEKLKKDSMRYRLTLLRVKEWAKKNGMWKELIEVLKEENS